MGLEVVDYLDDLDPTWPTTGDKILDGDNHLRNIKKAIRQTLPNLTGPMTKTQAQLNLLPNNWPAERAELLEHLVPKGAIMLWSGTILTIPAHWHLCDGTNVPGFGLVPDLRDRFVVGSGDSYDPGETGGANIIDTPPVGNHTHTAAGVSLSEAQLPAHTHKIVANVTDAIGTSLNSINTVPKTSTFGGDSEYALKGTATAATLGESSSVGGNATHTHALTSNGAHTHDNMDIRPYYYSLAYIIKIDGWVAP